MPAKKKRQVSVPDRRIRRTLGFLTEALISLTLEKGYDDVSIRDITTRAKVGYATFFRHYKDKDALLKDAIQGVLLELIKYIQTSDFDDPEGTESVRLFRFVQQNSDLCRVLVSSGLMERVQITGVRYVMEEREARPGSPIPAPIAANHLVAASLALIQWWLLNNMPYPPKRMGQIYQDLIIKPTKNIAFEPDPERPKTYSL